MSPFCHHHVSNLTAIKLNWWHSCHHFVTKFGDILETFCGVVFIQTRLTINTKNIAACVISGVKLFIYMVTLIRMLEQRAYFYYNTCCWVGFSTKNFIGWFVINRSMVVMIILMRTKIFFRGKWGVVAHGTLVDFFDLRVEFHFRNK